MSLSSRVLSLVKKATIDAITNATFTKSQSIVRQVCNVGASKAGISTSQVHNGQFNGLSASYFTVGNTETHYFVKQSARIEYIIERTNAQGRKNLETVFSMNMPTSVEDEKEDKDKEEASSSSSKK